MGYVLSAVARVLEQPTAWGAAWEMALLAGPLWAAALLGLLLGWAWRPRWAAGLVVATADGGSAAAAAQALAQPPIATLDFWKAQLPARLRAPLGYAGAAVQQREEDEDAVQRSSEMANEELAVGKDDLVNLWRLVEGRDGGPAWIKMMEKSLPTMTYQAWRRDTQTGPPQYQSSSIFENATPEEVRDFFGDDEFRMSNKWDDMLIYHKTLEECQTTGTMKVHWVRKFPFFCSDREYIIARRIWKLGGAYYCVTKGIPCSSIPRRNKPRRIDLYYSSWCVRAVESNRGNGGLTQPVKFSCFTMRTWVSHMRLQSLGFGKECGDVSSVGPFPPTPPPALDHGRRRLQRLGVLAIAAALGLLALLLAPRARGRCGDAEHGWCTEEGHAGTGEERGGKGRHGDGVGLLFLRRGRGLSDSLRGDDEVGFVGRVGPEKIMDVPVLLSEPRFPFIGIIEKNLI